MKYLIKNNIKKKLSKFVFAPHGRNTNEQSYSNFYKKGGNVFHLQGEGGETITRKTFSAWSKSEELKEEIFVIIQIGHNDGDDPQEFGKSRFSYNNLKTEIEYNLQLLNLEKIDAVYLAEDNLNYEIDKIQKSINEILEIGLTDFVGVFNWSVERLIELQELTNKKCERGISFIITTELSILKPNFGIWDGYTLINEKMENFIKENELLLIAWTTFFNQSIYDYPKIEIDQLANQREKERWDSEQNRKLSKKINEICKIHGITPMQYNQAYINNLNYDTLMIIYEDHGPKIETSLKSLEIGKL